MDHGPLGAWAWALLKARISWGHLTAFLQFTFLFHSAWHQSWWREPLFFYYFILVFWVCPLSLLSCGGEWAPFYILIIYVKICGPRDGRYASHPRGTASDHLRGRKSKAHAAGLDVFYVSKFSEIWTSSHLVRPLSYLFICLFFFFYLLFIYFFFFLCKSVQTTKIDLFGLLFWVGHF